MAAADPGGFAERWLDDIESCKNAVAIVGTLFVFTLVFRFNACYDRWWDSRIFWVRDVLRLFWSVHYFLFQSDL